MIDVLSTVKKLKILNLQILDTYIEDIQGGSLRATDLAPIVMYLNNNNIKIQGDRGIDDKDKIKELSTKTLSSMGERDKMYLLQHLVLDKYIDALTKGELKAMELSPLVTLLKNNEIISKEKTKSKIDELRKKKGKVVDSKLFK